MIYIDYKDRRPIYEQIVERFQMLIVKGVMEPDSQIPSVRELATTLAVNPNTVQKAYAILEQNGFIYPVKGRGNFVTGGERLVKEKQQTHLKEFWKVVQQAEELGIAQEKLQEDIRQIYAAASEKKAADSGQEGKHDRNK